jgi:hypothetical protein
MSNKGDIMKTFNLVIRLEQGTKFLEQLCKITAKNELEALEEGQLRAEVLAFNKLGTLKDVNIKLRIAR